MDDIHLKHIAYFIVRQLEVQCSLHHKGLYDYNYGVSQRNVTFGMV